MIRRLKFIGVTRTIDPKTRIHYLNAIDEDGIHWMAEMEHKTEPHLCYSRIWYKDPQQPVTYD